MIRNHAPKRYWHWVPKWSWYYAPKLSWRYIPKLPRNYVFKWFWNSVKKCSWNVMLKWSWDCVPKWSWKYVPDVLNYVPTSVWNYVRKRPCAEPSTHMSDVSSGLCHRLFVPVIHTLRRGRNTLDAWCFNAHHLNSANNSKSHLVFIGQPALITLRVLTAYMNSAVCSFGRSVLWVRFLIRAADTHCVCTFVLTS